MGFLRGRMPLTSNLGSSTPSDNFAKSCGHMTQAPCNEHIVRRQISVRGSSFRPLLVHFLQTWIVSACICACAIACLCVRAFGCELVLVWCHKLALF